MVDGVNEMFGGLKRQQGYEELSAFDSDADQLITSADQAFDALSIWRDLNNDGKADNGEIDQSD